LAHPVLKEVAAAGAVLWREYPEPAPDHTVSVQPRVLTPFVRLVPQTAVT
jgi:hypothetical protein